MSSMESSGVLDPSHQKKHGFWVVIVWYQSTKVPTKTCIAWSFQIGSHSNDPCFVEYVYVTSQILGWVWVSVVGDCYFGIAWIKHQTSRIWLMWYLSIMVYWWFGARVVRIPGILKTQWVNPMGRLCEATRSDLMILSNSKNSWSDRKNNTWFWSDDNTIAFQLICSGIHNWSTRTTGRCGKQQKKQPTLAVPHGNFVKMHEAAWDWIKVMFGNIFIAHLYSIRLSPS